MGDDGVDDQVGRTRRAAAIGDFAGALRDLRRTAGNPSFREMSGRSRAISHTTLHEAAQGNRLPSWSTTVEFVKACGGDPSDYRRRWDDATRRVQEAGSGPVGPVTVDSPEQTPEDAVGDAGEDSVRTPPLRRPVLLGVAAVITVGVAVVAVVLAGHSGGSRGAADPSNAGRTDNVAVGPAAASAKFRAADCPVQQSNPPQAPPAHPGDRGKFVTDLSYPDCSHVRRGEAFVKAWRLKNAGSVPWRGYVLHRLDLPARRDSCQTITDIPIKNTDPGDFVNIHAEVTAPADAGFCFVRFRILDAAGADAFPSGRPLNFQVIVD